MHRPKTHAISSSCYASFATAAGSHAFIHLAQSLPGPVALHVDPSPMGIPSSGKQYILMGQWSTGALLSIGSIGKIGAGTTNMAP